MKRLIYILALIAAIAVIPNRARASVWHPSLDNGYTLWVSEFGDMIESDVVIQSLSSAEPVIDRNKVWFGRLDYYEYEIPYVPMPVILDFGFEYKGTYTEKDGIYHHDYLMYIELGPNNSFYEINNIYVDYEGPVPNNYYWLIEECWIFQPSLQGYSGQLNMGGSINVDSGESRLIETSVPAEPREYNGYRPTTITYQWKKKVGDRYGNGTWLGVPGANGESYQTPPLTEDVSYVRLAMDEFGEIGYTDLVHFIIGPGHYEPPTPPTPQANTTKSSNKNYVSTIYPRFRLQTTDFNPDNIDMTTTYYDGLGRESQTHLFRGSPSGKNIVSFTQYDNMGRGDTKTYMPYVNNTLTTEYVANPLAAQQQYYETAFAGDEDRYYAFSEREYDAAGVLKRQSGPGHSKSMGQHPVEYDLQRYGSSGRSIKKMTIVPGTSNISVSTYSGNNIPIMVSKTKQVTLPGEPPVAETYEYTDSRGHLLASEVKTTTQSEFTYYVYDNLDRLRYTIPHVKSSVMGNGTYDYNSLTDYCFYTEYDEYGRVTRQKNPGAEEILYVYDKRGRLTMSQDGNQRAAGMWHATKYDSRDRVVMTGVYRGGTYEQHRDGLKNLADNNEQPSYSTGSHSYTNTAYPALAYDDVLTVNYYDDYLWMPYGEFNSDWNDYRPTPVLFSPFDPLVRDQYSYMVGLLTGSKTKVLDSSPGEWLTTVTYYDEKRRAHETVADLYPSGRERVVNGHNSMDLVTQTKVRQEFPSTGTVHGYTKNFQYDSHGRLIYVSQKIHGDTTNPVPNPNRGGVDIAEYSYDDMNRVATKAVHNNIGTTTYEYDILGRNIAVNDPPEGFSYRLGFDKPAAAGLPVRHDGLISHYTYSPYSDVDYDYRRVFDYDTKGQLTNDRYTDAFVGFQLLGMMDEATSYDSNGNPTSITRNNESGGLLHRVDNTYHPNSNLLQSTTLTYGNGTSHTSYLSTDANGNQSGDGVVLPQINYNILNLPSQVVANNQTSSYIYSARGEKLALQTGSSVTYYRGVMVYAQNGGQPEQLQYMMHPEGIVAKEGGTYIYKYFRTDHLGNVRAVLSPGNGVMVREQTEDYYASGIPVNRQNYHLNKYLLQGKEYQDAWGLSDTYDFGARYYSSLIGRWMSPDPALQGLNPYMYCGNNAVMYVDPDGRWWFLIPLIGGAANWAFNGAEFTAEGLAYFAMGAVGSLGAAGGAAGAYFGLMATGFGNSVIKQGYENGWNNIDYFSAMAQGMYYGGMGALTMGFSTTISPFVGKLFAGITNPAVRSIVTEGVTNAGTGFVAGTGLSLMSGYSLSDALDAGKRGAAIAGTMGILQGSFARLQQKAAAAQRQHQGSGDYTVYEGYDSSGEVRYVGITGREPNVRYQEHLRATGTGRELLFYRNRDTGLSKTAARIMEQNLINQYGLSGNGGQLLNIRNSIAPSHWNNYGIQYYPKNLMVK